MSTGTVPDGSWKDRLATRFDAAQGRHPLLGHVVNVQRRFGTERGANLAAALSMRGFLALFPIVVLAISIVGFAGGDPVKVAHNIVSELGLSGEAARTITDAVRTAQQSKVAASIVGIVGLLWAGTGLAASVTATWNQTWAIPGGDARGRLLGFVWLLAGLLLLAGSLFLAALVGRNGALPEIGVIAGVLVDVALFLWTAWLLPSRRIPLPAMVPAAVCGAIAFGLVKIVGTLVVPAIVTRSSALYGTIGAVFAILVWLLVLGRVVVYVTLIERETWLVHQARLKERLTADPPA